MPVPGVTRSSAKIATTAFLGHFHCFLVWMISRNYSFGKPLCGKDLKEASDIREVILNNGNLGGCQDV